MAWGYRVRLAGGRLAHYAGSDQGGTTLLAHNAWAWTGTLRPVADDAPECPRCVRRLPELERMVERALSEGIARRCECGALTWWPGFTCPECKAPPAAWATGATPAAGGARESPIGIPQASVG